MAMFSLKNKTLDVEALRILNKTLNKKIRR